MPRFNLCVTTANGTVEPPNDGPIEADSAADALAIVALDIRENLANLPDLIRSRAFRAPLTIEITEAD